MTVVECYDPQHEEIYFYDHSTQSVADALSPHETPIAAMQDPLMRSVINLQTLIRAKLARRKVQRQRFHYLNSVPFQGCFITGNGQSLFNGHELLVTDDPEPVLALINSEGIARGRHQFVFHLALTSPVATAEVGFCPYLSPPQLRTKHRSGCRLREIVGAWSFSSAGDIWVEGQKVEYGPSETLSTTDVVGICIDYVTLSCTFYRNGELVFRLPIPKYYRRDLVPAVSLTRKGSAVTFQWVAETVDMLVRVQTADTETSEQPIQAESQPLLLQEEVEPEPSAKIVQLSPPIKAADTVVLGECRVLLNDLLRRRALDAKKVAGIRGKAAEYAAAKEAEVRQQDLQIRRRRREQHDALHRAPDMKARRLAQQKEKKRLANKYTKVYRQAREQSLRRQAEKEMSDICRQEEESQRRRRVAAIRKAERSSRSILKVAEVRSIFDACCHGVPLRRLQEVVVEQVNNENFRYPPSHLKAHARNFEQLCQSVQNGYILESSHPYSAIDGIDERLEVGFSPPGCMGGSFGVCIAFDPCSDTQAGDGEVTITLGPSASGDQCVSQSWQAKGLEGNMSGLLRSATDMTNQDCDTEGNVTGATASMLPGIGTCPPLFIGSDRFIVRFRASSSNVQMTCASWGWKMVAWPAAGPEEGWARLAKAQQTRGVRELLQKRNRQGDTPLHVAAWENNVQALSYLLNEGADVNATDSLRTLVTPLHLSVMAGNRRVTSRLLDYGADILRKTTDGELPIHYACRAQQLLTARKLIKREGQPWPSLQLRNRRGQLPGHLIDRSTGHSNVLYELVKSHTRAGKGRGTRIVR